MAGRLLGPIDWELSRDKDGHRDYRVIYKVETTSVSDGPQTVLSTPNLPLIGATWALGNDSDPWAFCWPTLKISPYGRTRDNPHLYWTVEMLFSTRPLSRCQDETIEDPLLEPQKISGTFIQDRVEATTDRHGEPIENSAGELLRGMQAEFDYGRPAVRIGQNVATLGLATFSAMVNTVNDATLWGLPARTIKLSNVTWERKLFGICDYYYTRTFDFEVDFNTFDREVIDEGTKALHGHHDPDTGVWTLDDIDDIEPDPTNPQHYDRYKDFNEENTRVKLDGEGQPWDGSTPAGPVTFDVEYYGESDFLLLGIPTVLGA